VPQWFASIPTISRQIAHEPRTVPVVAIALPSVGKLRGRCLGTKGEAKRAPMCRYLALGEVGDIAQIGCSARENLGVLCLPLGLRASRRRSSARKSIRSRLYEERQRLGPAGQCHRPDALQLRLRGGRALRSRARPSEKEPRHARDRAWQWPAGLTHGLGIHLDN
jgi:hypothetical protein